MKRPSYKNMGRTAATLAAGLVLLMSFQNCGKAGFDAELESQLDSSSTDISLADKYGTSKGAKVEKIPFAFDAGFDTMTYLSCADSHLSRHKMFYSLMAGAYSTAGVKLSNDFWDYADSNFKPSFSATRLSESEYKGYLADSPANKGAIPTMALRVKNNLVEVFGPGGTVNYGKEIVPLVGNLTNPLVMDSLMQKGVGATFFPFSAEAKNLEGSLQFNSSEADAEDMRQSLMTSASLVLSYLIDETEINKIRAENPEEYPVRTAYGKAYKLTYSPYVLPGSAASNPSRVLTQVMESDLSKKTGTSKAWNCGRVYKIVRAEDAATFCPAQTYAEVRNNNSYRNEYEILRRQLRADQWDINTEFKCIVPKAGVSCYKEESFNNQPVVQYDVKQPCYRSNGTVAKGSACMHFATICTRD